MKQLLTAALLVCIGTASLHADESPKDALKNLQEFIGGFKGNGGPLKPKPASSELWSETINWSWRYKDNDVYLLFKIEKGKHFKEGELRYLADKKLFQLTMTDVKDAKREFTGEYKDNALTLERVDPDSKETQRLVINTTNDGDRFNYRYERKPDGRTAFLKDYQVGATRLGTSLGKVEKKKECVVSGGAGTMSVTYKGETFYLCCSGCADEFKANPEKYIKEFKAKMK